MVPVSSFFDALKRGGADFFTGVPDSLLKDLCAYITEHARGAHVIAANEGNAVALAAGHHLATGRAAIVYMQNSGLGNTVNPLLSLADKAVYRIPMLLIIGWRGEPGVHDEPQHRAQGPLTIPLLRTLGIPHVILPQSERAAVRAAERAYARAQKEGRAVALVVRAGTFSPHALAAAPSSYPLTREAALHIALGELPKNAVVVSTTGKLSRELFEWRKERGGRHGKDFLTVGSMGHASQIALGIALSKPRRPVYCFDGDGAALMHLGGWAIIGQEAPKQFRHVVFNNGMHESVGGQPTAGFDTDFPAIARACGYRVALAASNAHSLEVAMQKLRRAVGPAFLEIRVRGGSRKDLGRPTRTPLENKQDFMRTLRRA